jgi:hypothetical protein
LITNLLIVDIGDKIYLASGSCGGQIVVHNIATIDLDNVQGKINAFL